MKVNKLAMQLAEEELKKLPVKHRAGNWVSINRVRNLLYNIYCNMYPYSGEEEE